MEIRKVLLRSKKDGIKMVIIPKSSNIKAGDLVLVTNNLNMINQIQQEEKHGRS